MKKFHTVVIGGGCLGTASAVSLANHMKSIGEDPASVCLVEKNVLCSAISNKHSGIVRAANADINSARLAKIATEMWLNIKDIWDTEIEPERHGAIWIARKNKDHGNEKWDELAHNLKSIPIHFEKISAEEVHKICPDFIRLYDDEVFYHEPDACQFDPSEIRLSLYQAIRRSDATIMEKEEVIGFKKNQSEKITEIILKNGAIKANYVINATGAWSPKLFQRLGISIPVGVEPVFVVNWLNSLASKKTQMPIIADYVNRAYFRSWRDGEIHMHQPRKRGVDEASTLFANNPLAIVGADFINDPANQMQGFSQLSLYEEIANRRFNNLENTVFSSGYQSYFDITPDLKFILGPDSKINNLLHCLGSGQAFKYAPVFGEMMVQFLFKPGLLSELGSPFSIKRFNSNYMKNFWNKVSGSNYTLNQDNSNL